MIKEGVGKGTMNGIKLLGSQNQQIILQYANDISLMIATDENIVRSVINILSKFSIVLGLEINWRKNLAYWCILNNVGWTWAQEHELSKLLGTSLRLDLAIEDVDRFLLQKIWKKLKN